MNKNKAVKPFSDQEVSELNKIRTLENYSKEKSAAIKLFCKKNKRPVSSIYYYMSKYSETVNTSVNPTVSEPGLLTRKKFVIPVTNYELHSDGKGKLNLVLNF